MKLRIIVLGYIVRGPIGGLSWHHLQYVLGLSELGHDVYFVEDSDDYPACYDPTRFITSTDPGFGLTFAADAFSRLGLGDRWAYFDAHTARWLGPRSSDMARICGSADLLLNISGVNPLRSFMSAVPVRALVDTDPAFTQIRNIADAASRERSSRHNAFFSFGENIATGISAVPHDGFDWQPTRQPIVLDQWRGGQGVPDGHFTTVMQWDSYPPLEYAGMRFGMKSESFKPFEHLPQHVAETLEITLGSPTAPSERLTNAGWIIRDPWEPTRDPWTYRDYLKGSKAEFTVAKHGYVVSRSGWFSERSAAYLASGRPVVTQETGFSDWLSPDGGVLPFSTLGEAIAAIDGVAADYLHHCRAARAVAEEYFDARRILPNLIDAAFAAGAPSQNVSTGRQHDD